MDLVILDYLTLFVVTVAFGYFIQKHLKKRVQHIDDSGVGSSAFSQEAVHTEVLTENGGINTGKAAKSRRREVSKNNSLVQNESVNQNKQTSQPPLSEPRAVCACSSSPDASCCRSENSQKSAGLVDFKNIKIYYGSQTGTAKVRSIVLVFVSLLEVMVSFLCLKSATYKLI